jgi:hypothetical protein
MKAAPSYLKTLTPVRACPRCPRCRGYVWHLIKVGLAGRFKGIEVCLAGLLALVTLEVGS